MSRRRTRARDLQAPFYGVRAPAGILTLGMVCLALLETLAPGAVISHITAARLHDLPLPPTMVRARIVHVSVPRGRRAPEGKRTVGHQTSWTGVDVDERHGFACTTPARTFCDVATLLTLARLVAVGDHLIRRDVGPLDISDLAAAVNRHPGRRQRALLRRALELLDDRSESPKESELRVLIIEAGLPRPTCNHRVFDTTGRFVARVDLAYPELKIAIEYEGDHHRSKEQWRKDLARRRRLEALGWIYLSVMQDDISDPTALLADLKAALAARGATNAR